MAYEICQVNMAFGVQQHVIRFEIPMDDTLGVDILQGTTKLCHPEPDCVLCEALAGDVEAEVTAVHEINNNVTRARLAMLPTNNNT